MSDPTSPNLTANRLHLGCGLNAPADWLNVDGSAQVWFAQHPGVKRLLVAARIYPASQAAIPPSRFSTPVKPFAASVAAAAASFVAIFTELATMKEIGRAHV